jgi:transcriptional regulator with XRE-family HTH domain
VPRNVNGRAAILGDEVLWPAELRTRRQALALTQAALAGLLGVTPTTVARWERAEQRIGNPERLAAALARLESQDCGARRGPAEAHPRHNLPLALSSLVGREQAVHDVKLVDTRLLTVVGTGGIGKTRLALEVAFDLVSAFADGVWLVELAPLIDPALVARTVAATLEIREKAQQPLVETRS